MSTRSGKKKPRKAENVHIRLSSETKDAVAKAAVKREMTVSMWLLTAALEKLERDADGSSGHGKGGKP